MERPLLNKYITAEDFTDFYWLKEELIIFCRAEGINISGGKHELEKRIMQYLRTGEKFHDITKGTVKSKFDWNKTELTLATIITDNYKNTENVRAFMTKEIGKHFRFNTNFMEWMKKHSGSTLLDAVNVWNEIYKQEKEKKNKTEISPQFEYNTYIRDFLADNKEKKLKDAIHCWKLKKNQRGDNKYSRKDLFLEE